MRMGAAPMRESVSYAPPRVHFYKLQDNARVPLGGARYKVKHYSWLESCSRYGCNLFDRVVADGATVDLGMAPLQARRDLVAAVAYQLVFVFVSVDACTRIQNEPPMYF